MSIKVPKKVKHSKDRTILSERLELLRGKTSQEKTAENIGISLKQYQKYESGSLEEQPSGKKIRVYDMPNSDSLLKIADYYNVSTDYLLGKIDSYTLEEEYICNKTGFSANAIYNLMKEPELIKHLNYLLTCQSNDIKNIINELYFACLNTAQIEMSAHIVEIERKQADKIIKLHKKGIDITKQLNEINPKEIDNYIDIMDKSEREILKSRLKLPHLTDNLIDNTNTEYFLNN